MDYKHMFLALTACLLLLAACGKVEPPVPDDDDRTAIAFGTDLEEATKGDVTLPGLKSGGWGLYGYYTGTGNFTTAAAASGVLFNHREVRWAGTDETEVWDYSLDVYHQQEYWPMASDEKLSFFAYAPYSLYSSSVGVDGEKGPYVTYTASTDLTQQKDLLWATNTSGLPHRNVSYTTYPDGKVDMHFRHAPAKIHFKINGKAMIDNSADRVLYSDTTAPDNPEVISYAGLTQDETLDHKLQWNWTTNTAYKAYRTRRYIRTEVYHQSIDGRKVLLDRVEMTNFPSGGVLHLNNSDPFVPDWSFGEDFITYTFDTDDLNGAIINPDDEVTLLDNWATYQGVDTTPKELLKGSDNYIFMIPKAADELETGSKNIHITVDYHLLGHTGGGGTAELTKTTVFDRTETTWYITRSGNTYYLITDNSSGNDVFTDANKPANATWTASGTDQVVEESWTRDIPNLHSDDNGGNGFRAVGNINTDILGGRDYTVNLYLNGRDMDLTVIPQPWDLNEVVYDIDAPVNEILQALTYDADFIYQQIGDKVYINNRMGKFSFQLGTGKYLYWQASLIGDDAFAFTDENGEYLLDEGGNPKTSIRGDLSGARNYIYVKARNTSSPVTSQAKLRIYLFDAENHATVALPTPDWKFINATYTENGQEKRVQEWTVVQTAN